MTYFLIGLLAGGCLGFMAAGLMFAGAIHRARVQLDDAEAAMVRFLESEVEKW